MAFFQSRSLWVQEFAEGVAVVQFDPGTKAVRLVPEFLDDLESALDLIERHPSFRMIVLRSLKPNSFCQGPEPTQWRSMDLARWADRGQALWKRLANTKLATVAWIQGACLGAGLELALACRRIYVADRTTTTLGFTEPDVGLLPSWGSLGQLVHRVGLENAFPLILAGRRLSPQDAVALHLADRIVPDADPPYARLFDEVALPAARPSRGIRRLFFEGTGWGRRVLYRGIERLHRRRLPDALPGPSAAFETLRTFIERGDAAGQVAARDALLRLAQAAAFDNLIRFHELRERLQVRPAKSGSRTIGVIGATPLGLHVILESVRHGDQVILRESDETRLGMAILQLVKTVNHQLQTGQMKSKETQKVLNRIRSTITWKNFEELDLAVDMRGGSEERLVELDAVVPKKAPIVTTSLVGHLGDMAKRISPGRALLGLHVAEPIGPTTVAEIRQSESTSEPQVRQLREWAAGFGWAPIQVGDQPGLLVSRLWFPAWNEIVLLLREGARPDRIDQALARFGFGQHFLQSLDDVGLDRIQEIATILEPDLKPRIPIDRFWTEVVERGWRGRSTRKGFYRYRRRGVRPNDLLVNWLHVEGGGERMPAMSVADQLRYFQDRIVLLMVNEAFRCLEEGRVRNGDDLDLAMMLTEWAPHRGGPIRYAEQVGLAKIIEGLRSQQLFGERYEPCATLLERATGK
jgi:3-hydroxyacyl-CoA dehydrogenase/enoyl-CoA hydratase/3-hydroxybutyryl-CoA epimerase